eukprot:4729509-Alexandrium_andersonii.AAC.1
MPTCHECVEKLHECLMSPKMGADVPWSTWGSWSTGERADACNDEVCQAGECDCAPLAQLRRMQQA